MTNRTLTTSQNLTKPYIVRADQNAAAVYLASLAPNSRRTQRTALAQIAEIVTGTRDPFAMNWHALRFQHTAAIRAKLAETMTAGNANKHLYALRGVLKSAWRLQQMSAEDYTRARDLSPIQGERLPRGRALTPGEIAGLLNACSRDQASAGARDAALIALLYGCGLRRAECAGLELADYDADAATLRILGKGNKERSAPITQGTADALQDWLSVRGLEPGALFHPITKAGTLARRHMTAQAIYDALAKRATEAGIKNLAPHDFRRTFISHLLDAGADLSTVQRLAGHANVQTTARYDRRGEQAKRKAVDLLHVPYNRRAQA